MNEVQRVARQGFSLKGKNDLDLAFLSLRIALKAYFSTYNVIRNKFDPDDLELDKILEGNIRFCEACAETIVHFQHFFELIIKDILRRDHLLLASRIYSHPTILYKVLHNQPLNAEEEQKVQSVEFSEALKSLGELIKNNQIQCFQDLQFIMDHKGTLEELNTLRNRVWHRGAFFLSYTNLDVFIGKFVLPIIDATTQLSQYKAIGFLWKYKHTECGIDPIESIRLEYQRSQSPSVGKIALLKEIGRAAYNNPLFDKKVFEQKRDERIAKNEKKIQELEKRGEQIPKRLLISKGRAGMHRRMVNQVDSPYIEKAIKISKHEAEKNFFKIIKCPICAVESFILYDESDSFQDSNTGDYVSYNWVHSAKCECCTFEIDSKLEIEKYGLPIDDYWTVKEL